MAKIHITLVGREREPIYKTIMHCNPDKVLFIYSEETMKNVSPIEELVKKNSYHVPEFHREQFNSTKIQKIRSKLKRLFEDSYNNEYFTKDDEVTICLTGGTKPWSILFFDYFKNHKNVSFQLIDQNDNLTNLTNYETIKVKVPLTIEDRFALQGLKIKESHSLEDYTEADFAAISDIHQIREYNYEHFRELTNLLSKQKNQTHAEYKGSTIKYNGNNNKNKRNIVCKLMGKQGPKRWIVTSPNIWKLITNTGWFEVEVARLLHKLYPQAPMLLNCKLKFTSDKTKGEKNEIDIFMMIKGKLLCVECKTNVSTISDVNKFYEVARKVGLATKPIFFTLEKMVEAAQENCDERDIPHFNTYDREDAIIKGIDEYLQSNNA